jgi:hypothetical protein
VPAIRTIKLCIASTNFLCRFERRSHSGGRGASLDTIEVCSQLP